MKLFLFEAVDVFEVGGSGDVGLVPVGATTQPGLIALAKDLEKLQD